MKHFLLIIALTLLPGGSSWAQDNTAGKRLENNLMIGAGLFGETGNQARDVFPGAVLRLSYGLDVRLGDRWSVMPGAGIRTQIEEINHIGWDGGDPDGMSMADVFCQARYHFESEGARMVISIGPQVSFMTVPDTYYFDADPNDPRGGKEKFKKTDVALQPGIAFLLGKHWQWGMEASIGMRNMLKQYPEYDVRGSVRLHNLMVVCGFRF